MIEYIALTVIIAGALWLGSSTDPNDRRNTFSRNVLLFAMLLGAVCAITYAANNGITIGRITHVN